MKKRERIVFSLVDTYRHKGLRRQLIDTLRTKGINDEAVLSAMGELPRHFFLEKAFDEWAYQDKPFPIGEDQTISQPFTVAYQTQLLRVSSRDKILEIGTGSGYQAAVLAKMGARVFSIERQEVLFNRAKALLQEMGLLSIRCFLRDGSKGLPEFAPFDKILVTAGAREVPKPLLEQLDVGGVIVIPVGSIAQKMTRIRRINEEEFEQEVFDDFRFVPLLEGIVRKIE